MPSRSYRVLLVEDDDDHYAMIKRMNDKSSQTSLQIFRSTTLAGGLDLAAVQSFDVVLLDLRLPDTSGIETLQRAHEHFTPAMPILVLTSIDDQDLALQAIQKGAQDFLCKGMLTPYILSNAIRNAIERKRIDRLLNENIARIDLTQKAAQLASWELDFASNSIFWSGQVEEIFGFKRENAPTREDFWTFIHPDDREPLNRALDLATREGIVFESEFRYQWPDGTYRNIGTKGSTFFDKNGNPSQMLGINFDLTERKRREEELKHQQKVIQTITENAVTGLFMVDSDGIVNYVNPSAKETTGYSDQDFIGRRIDSTLTYPQLQEASSASLNHQLLVSLRTFKTIKGMEQTFTRSDGRLLPVSISIAPISGDDGHAKSAVIEMQDITRWKMAESDLIEAKEAAEAGNLAKMHFLTNMSHEIRTPLGAVLGYSDLLTGDNLSKEERNEYSDLIKKNGMIVVSIINDLLDLSKVEAGKLDVQKRAINLAEFLSEIFVSLKPKAELKKLDFSFEILNGTPTEILTDIFRFKQVLLAVIGNAIKFTHTGSVAVTVQLGKRTPQSTDILLIEVRDSGVGIAPEKMRQLFDPFTQVDETATRKYGGAGLGLALARRLSRMLGGDVTLEKSEIGKGSIFLICIDPGRCQSTFQEEKTFGSHNTPSLSEKSKHPRPLLGFRILLAEDSLDTQFIVKRMLQGLGAQVEIANNGLEAIRVVQAKGAFDVILMDLQMPVMDGFQALRDLRKEGYVHPILAFTAHALQADRERCLSTGFDDHITKPVSRDRLVDAICFNIHGHHAST